MNFAISKMFRFPAAVAVTAVGVGIMSLCPSAWAQSDAQLRKSLQIKPDQSDVDYDIPAGDQLKGCKVASSKEKFGLPGYVVHDAAGQILRLFLDRNQDRGLDQWSYYKDGIEVYRDSDNNFNGKLDEFRWLGTGGTRIGVDANEDGAIDKWTNISVEEVAREAFYAIQTADQKRFARLLITDDEFKSLGLSGSVGSEVAKRIETARRGFGSMVKGQKQIGRSSEYIHSGNGQPGLAAVSKRDGISRDLVCYDHASTVFKTGEKFGNIALGTVVRVGDNWRLIELPEIVDPKKPIMNGGALFPMQMMDVGGGGDFTPSPNMEELGKLYDRLEKTNEELDKLITGDAKANAVRIASLEREKALIGKDIFILVDGAEKLSWLQTITDNVADAYRAERFPDGLNFLSEFSDKLKGAKFTEGLDYIRWRSIFAEYSLVLEIGESQARKRALQKLMGELEKFYKEFPKSEYAPQALHQLGLNSEIDGGDKDKAIEWYRKLATEYPKSNYGKRGAGAIARIEGKGKKIRFVGTTDSGKRFDISNPALRGKVVIIHFWETWCTNGFDDLKKVNAKYDKEIVLVGANIEKDTKDFRNYMKENRDVNWTQLHAPGGMEDSPLAIQVGLVSEPMVMIFDKDGKLVESQASFSDLDREIQRLTR